MGKILDLLLKSSKPPAFAAGAPIRLLTAESLVGEILATRNPYIHQEMKREQSEDPDWKESKGEHWPRILGLPIREVATPETADRFTYENADARAYDEGFRFSPSQTDCILQFEAGDGLLAQERVGGGKTLIGVTIVSRAARRGVDRSMLLIPASVYHQFMATELPKIRLWMPLACKFFGLGGMSAAQRAKVASSSGSGCYVMPYSVLSQKDARDLLRTIAPKLVVADEAHMLKNRDAARTKRFLDCLSELDPQPLFAAMSGTLTNKQLTDYHHLAVRALGDRVPLPTGAMMGAQWSAILGASSIATDSQARELAPLHRWAQKTMGVELPYTIDGYRTAFRHRLGSAPGVVLSGKDELGVSLYFENLDVPEPGKELTRMMKDVRDAFVAPNGDDIAHAMHTYKWLFELSAGFYNNLVWPTPKNPEHERRIEAAKIHHVAQQLYTRELRQFLKNTSIAGLDTPMLVGNALSRPDKAKLLPMFVQKLWKEMKALEFAGMPERISVPVRIDDYKIKLAVEWAKGAKGGILWCYNNEVIDWCLEYLRAAGVDAYEAKAGQRGNEEIAKLENGKRIAVASLMAHSTGKNLQYHYHKQLVLQWPRDAKTAEQMIGRTHRQGQPEDEITVHLALGPEFDHQNYAATLTDSLYMKLTTGSDQKVLYGTYTNPPKIYDPRLLDHLGFQVKKVKESTLRGVFGA